jgi:PAS domain S-box-containing protein
MYETDMQGIIQFANPAFAQIFGFESEKMLLGTNIGSLYVFPTGREEFLQKLRERDGLINGEVVFVKREDGQPFLLSVDSHLIYEGTSEVAVVGVGRDATAEYPFSRSLVELWQREHTLVARSLVGIYVIQDGQFVSVNEKMADIFGYREAQELVGVPFRELVAPGSRSKVETEVSMKSKGEAREPYEFRGVKRDGSIVDVVVDSAQITYDGRAALLGTLRDVTPEKLLRTRLEEVLRERTEVLEHLSVNLAHEMNTPVSAVYNMVENYRAGLIKGEEVRVLVEDVFGELERLVTLSNKLWDLVGLESGGLECVPRPVNVTQVINETWKVLGPKANSREIVLRLSEEFKHPQSLTVDPALFRHIIINLLDNAIKYSYRRTYVDVELRTRMGAHVLSVSSKGREISEQDQGRIFERYYRTRSALDMVPIGSGVGLYLVKRYAEAMGGRVEVRSIPVPDAKKGEHLNIFSVHLG